MWLGFKNPVSTNSSDIDKCSQKQKSKQKETKKKAQKIVRQITVTKTIGGMLQKLWQWPVLVADETYMFEQAMR